MKIKDNLGNTVVVPRHLERKVRRLIEKGDMKGVSALAMQFGGSPVNMEGYTPGAESFDNPFNIIPGGNITMKDTPFPVVGYPLDANMNVGMPRLMKPGTDHMFKGAAAVLEIPKKQSGGSVWNSNQQAYNSTNPEEEFEANFEDYLTRGLGLVPGTAEYDAADNSKEERDYYERDLFPVMLDKNRSFTPSTLPTKLTPIPGGRPTLPQTAPPTAKAPGSYTQGPYADILSPLPSIGSKTFPTTPSPEEAPQTGETVRPGQPPRAPHYTIPDMFNPLVTNIEDGPPLTSGIDPYDPLESTGISDADLLDAANSGVYGEPEARRLTPGTSMVSDPNKPKTMEDMLGEFYARYPQLFDKMRSDNEANYAASTEDYATLMDKLRGYAGRQFTSSAAGTIAQSPYTKPVLQDRGFADARRQASRMPQYLLDVKRVESESQLRAVADTLRMQGARPSEISSLLAPLYSRHVSGQNELAAQRFATNAQADAQYFDFLTSLENANMASRTNNDNAILAAQNQQIQQLADTSTDYSKNLANLETMDVATRRGAKKEYTDNEYRTLLAEVGFVGKDLEKALEVLKTQRDDANLLAASQKKGPLTTARDAIPTTTTKTEPITGEEQTVVASPEADQEIDGVDLLESGEMPLGGEQPTIEEIDTTLLPTPGIPQENTPEIDSWPNVIPMIPGSTTETPRPEYETFIESPELSSADRKRIETYAGNTWKITPASGGRYYYGTNEVDGDLPSPNLLDPGKGPGAIRYAQKGDVILDTTGKYGAKGRKVVVIIRDRNGKIIYDARDPNFPPITAMPAYDINKTPNRQ